MYTGSWLEERDNAIGDPQTKEKPLRQKKQQAFSRGGKRGGLTLKTFDYVETDPRDNNSPQVAAVFKSHDF